MRLCLTLPNPALSLRSNWQFLAFDNAAQTKTDSTCRSHSTFLAIDRIPYSQAGCRGERYVTPRKRPLRTWPRGGDSFDVLGAGDCRWDASSAPRPRRYGWLWVLHENEQQHDEYTRVSLRSERRYELHPSGEGGFNGGFKGRRGMRCGARRG